MKILTKDLTGPALDWAVELAKGTHWSSNRYFCFDNPKRYDPNPEWRYSTDWSQGGPIIERERIATQPMGPHQWVAGVSSNPSRGTSSWTGYGSTPLIAAMRCFVASKLGDEVDVPEGLA